MIFQVYTYFGRVLREFEVPDNRTHHDTLEEARLYLVQQEKNLGTKVWIRWINK